MFVAVTTRCFAELSFDAALDRLVDLEFSAIELILDEAEGHIRPSEVLADLEPAIRRCRDTRRLSVCAVGIEPDADAGELYYEQFSACCKLAKALKVVTATVRSSPSGTPFNEEIERLRRLVALAGRESVRVGLLTETGRMSQDPDTACVICQNVEGLGITLDPSHFIYGPHQGARFEQVMKHVYHVRLRDTSKQRLQVRVGQGDVEYGRLVNQLTKYQYNRALAVDILPMPEVDQMAELRKMRLLLESLL